MEVYNEIQPQPLINMEIPQQLFSADRFLQNSLDPNQPHYASELSSFLKQQDMQKSGATGIKTFMKLLLAFSAFADITNQAHIDFIGQRDESDRLMAVVSRGDVSDEIYPEIYTIRMTIDNVNHAVDEYVTRHDLSKIQDTLNGAYLNPDMPEYKGPFDFSESVPNIRQTLINPVNLQVGTHSVQLTRVTSVEDLTSVQFVTTFLRGTDYTPVRQTFFYSNDAQNGNVVVPWYDEFVAGFIFHRGRDLGIALNDESVYRGITAVACHFRNRLNIQIATRYELDNNLHPTRDVTLTIREESTTGKFLPLDGHTVQTKMTSSRDELSFGEYGDGIYTLPHRIQTERLEFLVRKLRLNADNVDRGGFDEAVHVMRPVQPEIDPLDFLLDREASMGAKRRLIWDLIEGTRPYDENVMRQKIAGFFLNPRSDITCFQVVHTDPTITHELTTLLAYRDSRALLLSVADKDLVEGNLQTRVETLEMPRQLKNSLGGITHMTEINVETMSVYQEPLRELVQKGYTLNQVSLPVTDTLMMGRRTLTKVFYKHNIELEHVQPMPLDGLALKFYVKMLPIPRLNLWVQNIQPGTLAEREINRAMQMLFSNAIDRRIVPLRTADQAVEMARSAFSNVLLMYTLFPGRVIFLVI